MKQHRSSLLRTGIRVDNGGLTEELPRKPVTGEEGVVASEHRTYCGEVSPGGVSTDDEALL